MNMNNEFLMRCYYFIIKPKQELICRITVLGNTYVASRN